MKHFIFTSAAVFGLLLVGTGTSEAGGIRGMRYSHNHYPHGLHGGPILRSPRLYPVYPYPHYPRWHDTSHLHWHPGGWERHRDHFHYVPGHYDVHQTGHWDY